MNSLRTHTGKGILLAAVLLALPLLIIACRSDDDPSAQERVEQAGAALGGFGGLFGGYGQPGIWVNGSGKVTTEPDMATIWGGINATRDTVSEAHREAAELMNALLQSLTERGIAEDEIETTRYDISPEQRQDPETYEYETIGYTVSNEISVTVKDLDQVGFIIDDMVAAGGDDTVFRSVRFGVSDSRPLEVEARKLAVEDLIAKATQLADSAGVTLGDLVNLVEESSTSPLTFGIGAGGDAMEASSFTSISPGEFGVVIDVAGVFDIE